MRECWRWFGPTDPVTLEDIRQTGVSDLVSALHDVPIGDVWTLDAIRNHQALVENTPPGLRPLRWSVVESIPVHEDIKLARSGCDKYVRAWIQSMTNLAACGIRTICYNFMPVIDWTRTDLRHRMPSGAYALRFDQQRFAAFDLCILQREGAEQDYSQEEVEHARRSYQAMTPKDRERLTQNIIAGLPGGMTGSYGLADFRRALADYREVDRETLRSNLCSFLDEVLPVAEQLDVKLVIHPDDPPWDMFGLPRIICTAADLETLFERAPSPANGMTLCVGTYGSRPDNDLPEMAERFADRIYFTHLRGVTRDLDEQRSFVEAEHLDSDVDMVAVILALLRAESDGRDDIFFRPDHGHQMMSDVGKSGNPGYSAIGRMKGLAELRGVVRALSASPVGGVSAQN